MIAPTTHINSNPQNSSENKDQDPIVYVEYCHNCQSHLAIIRHQEKKYIKHFEFIKEQLAEQGYQVKKRPVPKDLFKRSPYCPPNVYYGSSGQIAYFPQIGGFEVYLNNERIFSKLQTKKWPTSQLLVSLIKDKEKETKNGDKKLMLSQQPIENLDKSQKQSQAKAYTDQHTKTFYLRSRKSPLDNERYSLQKRNLLKGDRYKFIKSFHNQSRDKKQIEDQKEAEIIKMYSPQYKKGVSEGKPRLELDGIPSIQGKARVKNANVYLAPIYPKSRVSYENYQKHRLIYAKKIHQEKVAYQAAKAQRKLQQVKHIPEPQSRQIRAKESRPKFNNHDATLNEQRQSIQAKKAKQQVKQINKNDSRQKKAGQVKPEEKKWPEKVTQINQVNMDQVQKNKQPTEVKQVPQASHRQQKEQEKPAAKKFEGDKAEEGIKEDKQPSNQQNYEDAFETQDKINKAQKQKVQPEEKQQHNDPQISVVKVKKEEQYPAPTAVKKEQEPPTQKIQTNVPVIQAETKEKEEQPEVYSNQAFGKEKKEEEQIPNHP